jgi:tRNA(Arg) A34 adenosine deaminase TadA
MTFIVVLFALGIVAAAGTMWGSSRNDRLRGVDPHQAQEIDAIRSFGVMGQSQRPRRDDLPKL